MKQNKHKNSALNYSLWLLGKRDRAIGEIKEKLVKKEYPREEISETVKFLIEKKFLDDERFAINYIRNQLSIKPLGKYQFKIKLKKKLVPDDIAEKAIAENSSDEKALVEKAFDSWIKRNSGKENKYEKVCRHLLSRGFEWDTVKGVVEENKSVIK